LRESTRYNYLSVTRKHISPAVGHLALAEVGGPDLRAFFVQMRDAGYSRSYRAIARHALSRTFQLALAEGLINSNPLAAVPALATEYRREVEPLDVNQVELLAQSIRPPYRAAILVMAYAGLRVGEVGALPIWNIDLNSRELKVHSTVSRAGGNHFISSPKTAAGRRTVPIPLFLAGELQSHLNINAPAPDGRVFYTPGINQFTEAHGVLHAGSLHKPFKAARRRANVPHATPHTFRHTYAALLIREGAHPKVIQVLMGHSTIKVTMDLYGHLLPGLGDEYAQRLDAMWRLSHGGH